MHFLTYVLIPGSGDIEDLVAESLAPFDEDLTVPAYKKHLHPGEIRAMAERFNTKPSDHDALAMLMPAWSGNRGGVDSDGLFAWKVHNPDGQWDWYTIGGRFDGAILGEPSGCDPYDEQRAAFNVITAGALAEAPYLPEQLPAFLVAPGSAWLEHRTFVDDEWPKLRVETKDDAVWLREVKSVLEEYPDHRVVGVDLHQ